MPESINLVLNNIGDIIALCSLIVAAAALIYEAMVKRYELTCQYYNDVLSWHDRVVEVLIGLRLNAGDPGFVKENLVKLSSLIETGRFYFPNIDHGDGFGKNKPTAYQGYRNRVLDLLVYAYKLFERKDCTKHLEHALMLQRLFTSHVFEYLNPKKHQKRIFRNTMIKCADELTIDEFLERSPDTLYTLFLFDDNKKHWTTRPTQREESESKP